MRQEFPRRTHGRSRTRLHRIWTNMRWRCEKPTSNEYHNYGGRGISVCERWQSFEAFAEDMGEPPTSTHSLDRIDGDRGYEPGNVRWATPQEQARNRRGLLIVNYGGRDVCLTEAAEAAGIRYTTAYARIVKHKWPVDEALSKPARPLKRRLDP